MNGTRSRRKWLLAAVFGSVSIIVLAVAPSLARTTSPRPAIQNVIEPAAAELPRAEDDEAAAEADDADEAESDEATEPQDAPGGEWEHEGIEEPAEQEDVNDDDQGEQESADNDQGEDEEAEEDGGSSDHEGEADDDGEHESDDGD